jgi:plastocyanin
MLSLLGVLLPCATAVAQTTHVVTVGDNFFSPSELTIQVGDTVEWQNAAGGNSHNVTADDGSFASTTASSFTFSRTFNEAGVVDYNCTLHPGMTGTITVQAVQIQAELALTEVSVINGSYPQGSMINIESEVDNIGSSASGNFSINHYISTNTDITEQDTLLGTENRSSVPAGENSNGSFNATIPANLPPGSYFIGSIIQFNDANSSNNRNFEDEPITVTASNNSFGINIGMMDAWFDQATDGQGFLITVYPQSKIMFVAWFTFDTERPPQDATATFGEAGHRWVTASGPYDGDTAVLDIFLSTGGTLNSPQPPVFTDPMPYGSMIITWTDCNTALLSYDIPSLGLMGDVVIERAFPENVPVCEAGQVTAE